MGLLMKLVGLFIIVILLNACSNSPLQKTYDSDFDRLDPAGKTNADGKTEVELNPTIDEEYQTGLNNMPTPRDKPLNNDAIIKLNDEFPFSGCNFDFSLLFTIKIDGKTVNLQAEKKGIQVSPGKQTLNLSLTAYHRNKPKYASTKQYQINFNKLDKVLITPQVFVQRINAIRQIVQIGISIKGLKFKINDSFDLKNSFSMIPSCG